MTKIKITNKQTKILIKIVFQTFVTDLAEESFKFFFVTNIFLEV